ncbi:MAG TPA: carboxypeptidase-like regulatory domain-containing protein [Candidatus Thermoplasmatota archaeon]|nr:carboxypeptidase-like regulatory domain-containing protein [Candidatus Thermoplasmatota archaeon]
MLLLALLQAGLLAGCAHNAQAPPGLPLDEHGDSLPTLHGIVVDGAIRPLVGATVVFLGTDVNATTDGEGRYEIRRPTLVAEDVLVSARKDGFLPRTQQSQVSGQRSTRLDFVLGEDPSIVPHVDVLQYRGTLRCDAAVAAAGQSQGAGCDADHREDDAVPPWLWEINPTPNLAGAVVDVDWEALTPASQTLHAVLRAPMAGGQGGTVVAEATGPSPLRLEVPAAQARTFGRWTAIRLEVDLAEQDGGLPGAAPRDQRFDAYASLFYVDPVPPGYSLA